MTIYLFSNLYYSTVTALVDKDRESDVIILTSLRSLIESHTTSLSPYIGEIRIWWLDRSIDRELAGWPYPESCSQPLNVQMHLHKVVPRGTLLGLILVNTLINDRVELRAPLASLQVTPSWAVPLILLVEGMPSPETLADLRSGPVWASLNSTWPRPRTCTWFGASPSIRTDGGWMVWEQPCGGLGGTVWWVDLIWQDTRSPPQLLCHSLQ